ncbi:sensor histidine kinase [Paenibacillus agaridevorans]|uniref:Sensor histidine kinase n=1 Tax=Paenibacillus agaridevorans TaxID=171404 RepID=A0A2R5EMA3_9BACL|nr:sensor histidine kinase [Paenibacillus agaridevorans]
MIKDVIIDKVHDSNQHVIDVIASSLDKNVEDIMYAASLFGIKGSDLFSDLLAFKDVQKLTTYQDYLIDKRISEMLGTTFSKTSGLDAQVFFVNNNKFVSYATNNNLDFPSLMQWLNQSTLVEPSNEITSGHIRWMEAIDLKQRYGRDKESFYFAMKVISDPDNGKMLGTLFVGIPYEYFEQTFAKGGSGQFQLYTSDDKLIYHYSKELNQGKHELEIRTSIPRTGWKLVYMYSSEEITAEISEMFSFYAIILSVCILSFLGISVMIAKTLHTPLNKLQKTAKQFGNGNRLVRFPAIGEDEVAALGLAFNHMLDQINLLLAEVEQEQEEKRIIELDALFSQIRPHFLLNTLNSIKCNLSTEGDSVNSRQIDALMSLLRAYMRVDEKCSLKQECKLLVDYVDIMQMRNDLGIQLEIHLEEEIMDIEVPRLFLQPLVENSIIHGFFGLPDNAAIWISAEQVDGYCRIEVKDNGTGISKTEMNELQSRLMQSEQASHEQNKRIGLVNVYNRLRLTYGAKVKVDLRSNEFDGLSIIVLFPISAGGNGKEIR